MRKSSFFLLLFLLPGFSVLAQPTQAEIDKMIKNAQDLAKKYGGDSIIKKTIKDQQDNKTVTTTKTYDTDPGSYGNVDNWKFPPKNTALLAALPKKTLSKTEMVSFLNDLYSQLSKKLAPAIGVSVQSIAAKYNNDGNRMGDAAVSGWYSNYQEEALLLIIKAAITTPDNNLLMNNCAALLNMSGIEQKAIPVLKYLLQSAPDNSTLLNNLGQAYAGLGATDTAMLYFGRCLKSDPEHPEACNTAGQIEATRGNTEKAIEYFEKSIKGAFNKPAALKLRKIKKDVSMIPMIRPRVKLPEYFNLFKYQLPAQCTSTGNAIIADAEHKAFREMMTKQTQAYGAKYAALAEKQRIEAMEIMKAGGAGRKLRKDEFMAHPFYEMCGIMARDVLAAYRKDVNNLSSKVMKDYTAEKKILENEYETQRKAMELGFSDRTSDEARCNARTALANQYLPKFAVLMEELQKKYLHVYQQYFDELAYWHYLSVNPTWPSGPDKFKMLYYDFIIHYLVMLGGVCQTKIILPCESKEITMSMESHEIREFECPLEIEIPFIVGKFSLDCDKISFSGGEGAVFSYEKNFKTKQSTLSVGIGAKLELGKIGLGPVEASLGAGVSESLFITFDGENKVADAGLKFGAKFGGGIEAKGEKSVAPGKSIEIKKDMGSKEISAGYSVGINSGWNFNDAPLKSLFQ
jgi:tetratricopeptide (TPR) repeat protein